MAEISPIGPRQVGSLGAPLTSRVGVKGEPPPIATPEGFRIRRKIMRDYGIEVLDSDVKFSGADCEAIEETLKEIKNKKRQHLIGVKQIIKNREYQTRLKASAHVHAGGAYDAENRRVYLFETLSTEEIPEVLTHEIGHAVSHFNVEFDQFMDFVKKSGYNMVEFRRYFVGDNQMHNIATKRVVLSQDEWSNVLDRFSMESLAKSEDVFGEIVLESHRRKRFPWDENPLEKFAWAYEWYVNRSDEFARLAEHAAEHGDNTWLEDYHFLRENVFGEDQNMPETNNL